MVNQVRNSCSNPAPSECHTHRGGDQNMKLQRYRNDAAKSENQWLHAA